MATADHERRRLERDLHDGAQQRLVALRIQLELAGGKLWREIPSAARAKLHALGEDVGETLDEIRELAHGVYPSLLADRGLAEALRSVSLRQPDRLAAQRRADRQVSARGRERRLLLLPRGDPERVEARRRTRACSRSRSRTDDALHFEVRDDGGGFNGEVVEGAGLTNMRDRLAAVGGELEITSAVGQGTVVTGTVPLEAR